MPRIHIPDDAPPVLAVSGVWPELAARAELVYHDTLPGSEDGLIERIADAEVVLNIRSSTFFTARVFDSCPRLRLLSVWGTGTDHVDATAAARHGVTVTNTPGVSAVSIAEHALALLLAAARRIPNWTGRCGAANGSAGSASSFERRRAAWWGWERSASSSPAWRRPWECA